MQKYAKLSQAPIFMPSVGHFAQGMLVHLPLFASQLTQAVSLGDITEILQNHYHESALISVHEGHQTKAHTDAGFLPADGLSGSDRLEIFTNYNDITKQFWLTARLDNLGKGASGAAVQNMNIALGLDETQGLSC